MAFEVSGITVIDGTRNITANTIIASGITYPTSDGTSGQVLITDGSGNLSFSTVSIDGSSYQTKADALAANTSLVALIDDRMQVSNVSTLVSTEVAALVDSAPTTLDTLNELAAALGDDPNFATTITASLGTKASNTHVNTQLGLKTDSTTFNAFVANTNTFIATKADSSSLSSYLQVANAAATYITDAPSNGTQYARQDGAWAAVTATGGISYSVSTSNVTASADEGILADTSGGSFTVTLPASPSSGDKVFIADADDFSVNNLTVARNGSTIEGASEDFILDIGGHQVGFIYNGSTWQVYPQAGLTSIRGISDSANSAAITINASKNVGIGTASPVKKLDVAGTSRITGEATFGNDVLLTNDAYVYSSNGGSGVRAGWFLDGTNQEVRGYTAGSEAMRINSNGNVGIGVVPDSFNAVDGALQIGTRNTLTSFSNDIGIGYNHYYSSGWKYANADVASRFSSTSSIPFLWQYAASGSADGAITWSEAMRIDSSGRVGIGTTSPDATLTVKPQSGAVGTHDNQSWSYSISSGAEFDLKLKQVVSSGLVKYTFDLRNSGTSYNNNLVLDRGNIGVGTTSPRQRITLGSLTATATATPDCIDLGGTYSTSAGSNLKLKLYEDGSITHGFGVSSASTDYVTSVTGTHKFFQSTNERMRIDSSGRLLVGKSSTTFRDDGCVFGASNVDVNGWSAWMASTPGASGGVLALNRDGSDGEQIRFHKDGAGFASIGNDNGDEPYFARSVGTTTGIKIANGALTACQSNGTNHDASQDLGASSIRWRNLYMAGDAVMGASSNIIYESGTTFNVRAAVANLTFQTNGANERMRIDSAGKVGVGITNPSGSFHLTTVDAGGSDVYYVAQNTTASRIAGYRILDESNQVGGVFQYDNGGNNLLIGTALASNFQFVTSNTERMRIDSSGNVLVATTSTVSAGDEGIQLGTNGMISTARNQTSTQYHMAFVNPNGTVGAITTLNNGTAFLTSSDERLKENIVDAPAGNIDAIRVRSFDWKADGSHQTYGMVAQELVDVAPEAVSQGETEDDMWGVDYSKLVPMMIKEIQDLKAEVAALKGE